MNNKYISKIILLLSIIQLGNNNIISQTSNSTVLTHDSLVFNEKTSTEFGNTTFETSTEAISYVKGVDIRTLSEPSLSGSLGGKIAGLTVMRKTVEPGSSSVEMYIRGKNTYNNNSNILIFVDGFESNFDNLLPEEIESISILKDAAALAIYGIRGANGVIFITTKRGIDSRLQVNFNTNIGFSKPIQYPQFLNAYAYASLYNEALSNDLGQWAPFYSQEDLNYYEDSSNPFFYPDVNWYNETLRPSTPFQQGDISIRGGNSSVKYYTLLGYLHSEKLYVQNKESQYSDLRNLGDYSRYNIRSNIDVAINKVFDLAVNVGGNITNNISPNIDNIFNIINQLPPNEYPVYNSDGSWAATSTFMNNPLASVFATGKRSYHTREIQSDITLTQNLDQYIKGLSLKESISFFGNSRNGYIINKDYERYQMTSSINEIIIQKIGGTNSEFSINEGGAVRSQMSRTSYNVQADYDYSLNKHSFKTLLGGLYSKYTVDGNNVPYLNANLYGKLGYNYNQRYLAQFAFSYSGSENLPKKNRFGLFPAVSLGWIISKENFMNDISFIDFLKIRASAGMVGSSDLGTTRFGYQTYYISTPETFNIGSAAATSLRGLTEGRLGNPSISYERNYKYNIGVDGNIYRKLSFQVDAFYEIRNGILAVQDNTIPAIVAITLPYENIGKVSNRGFELEATYSDQFQNLKYSVFGNISFAKSNIEYQAETVRSEKYLYRTGNPVGQYFGLEATGLFQSWEEINNPETPVYTFAPVQPGDIKYKDQNNDGFINEDDEIPIGYSNIPQVNTSLGINISYKAFDLRINAYGQARRNVMLSGNTVWAFYNNGQAPKMAKNRWVYYPEQNLDTRENASYPRLTASGSNHNYRNSTFWLKDASFLRLQNLEIGYSFPSNIRSMLKCENLRVFAQGSNLVTISKLSDFDPEIMNGYPINRSFALGLNVQY